MAEATSEKTAKKTTKKSEATKKAAAKPAASASKAPKDFQGQVMQMWGASLVVVIVFVLLFGIQTFFTAEESQIRRESYLANLEQLYQQEVQECFNLSAAADEAGTQESAAECLNRINSEGRYAELVRRWGGEDRLFTDLSDAQ